MRVLVTRPQPGADATARRLAAMGHEAVVLPLTRTEALAVGDVPDGVGYDGVVATSAAAIRHAPAGLVSRLAHLPLYAVAEKTAEAARLAGHATVADPLPDAAAMVAGLPERLPAGSRLLYLAGRVRTGVVESGLEAAGLHVDVVEVYDTVAVDHSPGAVAARLGAAPLDAALVYSANGASALSKLAANPLVAPAFARARFVCISGRVAETLPAALAARAQAAASPDEAAMLALLGARG